MKLKQYIFLGILISFFPTDVTAKQPNTWPGYYYAQEHPIVSKIEAYEKLAGLQTKLEEKLRKDPENADVRSQLQQLLKAQRSLIAPEEFNQKLGRAMVQGFASNDAWLYRDIDIANFWDGMWLGLGISSAQATSKVVGKHVSETADLLIGGLWRSFIEQVIDCSRLVRDGLFHQGNKPFQVTELTGLATMVNTTFVNLNTMLRDGLKDMLRGHDMTLRLVEDKEETNHRTLGWRMLVNAYVRQIDYIIQLLQIHLPYYKKTNQIVFFAEEIVRCLEDVKRILTDAKNVRELDDRLDANKNLINAIKANIANLFDRLKEHIEPSSTKSIYTPTQTKSSRSSIHDDYYDREHFPHQLHS